VTDDNNWQPPSGVPVPPPAQFSGSPFPAPTSQGYAGARPQGGQQPGWTPPPKPGLIPLRPLGFGTLLGAPFQVIRRNPRPTFGISLLLNGVVTLLFVGVIGGVIAFAFGRVGSANRDSTDEILAGSIGAVIVASLVPIALSVLVSAVLQGIIALEVSRGTIGEKLTVRGLWRLAKGRIGALIGWSAIATAVVVVVVTVLSVVVGLVIAFGGQAGAVLGIIGGILVGLVALVAWFWLSTKLSLIPSVLMLERVTVRAAIARSWSLTGGYFWRTLGTQLLVTVIVQVAAQVVTTPVSLLLGIGGALANPNSDEVIASVLLIATSVLTGIISVVFGALATVTSAAANALIYIDIRMRKEGLDLDLARFVEARQVGDVGVANPYLPAGTPVGAPRGEPVSGFPAPPNDSPWA
jgi:MFS family permease